MERLLLRVKEAADISFSRSKMYELIARGVIPSIKVGNSIRVPAERLRRWIAAQSLSVPDIESYPPAK